MGDEGARVKFPYPNTAQWVVIWAAAIFVFIGGDYRFFEALGAFDGCGRWVGPYFGLDDGWRFVFVFVLPTLLLVWQLAKPVTLRSPLILPMAFVLVCLGWYAVGRVEHGRAARAELTLESFTHFLACRDPQ